MKAAVRDRFGAPSEVVELRELDAPVPAEGEVLVRVHAASLNIADWYAVVGRPRIARRVGSASAANVRLSGSVCCIAYHYLVI